MAEVVGLAQRGRLGLPCPRRPQGRYSGRCRRRTTCSPTNRRSWSGCSCSRACGSKLEPGSFDLVHARYQIAPLGRGHEQVASYRRLVRPGGSLVLEEWDLGSWHFNPTAPAAERLIGLLSEIFAGLGGEAGRELPQLLREIGIEQPEIDAHVIALEPGHPYLRLPLQFSVALEARLLEKVSAEELASLRK